MSGLVAAGILVGDHYAVLTAVVAFRVEKGQRWLEIELVGQRSISEPPALGHP